MKLLEKYGEGATLSMQIDKDLDIEIYIWNGKAVFRLESILDKITIPENIRMIKICIQTPNCEKIITINIEHTLLN